MEDATLLDCYHVVCHAEGRQQSCMFLSGEVLWEYCEEEGKIWWAVDGKGNHRVTSWDIDYGIRRGQELWKEYLETLEAGRYALVSEGEVESLGV